MASRPATGAPAKTVGRPADRADGVGRIGFIDALRGLALVAMVLYHLVWLLNLFGYTRFELFTDPFWLAARTVILCSFLGISGFVIGLAGEDVRSWTRYLRRLGLLTGAALAVTLGTLWSFPDAYVFFGVLHCLALSAVLALAFRRLPWWGVALAAAFWLSVTRLPFVPHFDQPWLAWLGLVSRLPVTNDYVPIFPWFGVVLAGLAIGKLAGPAERFGRAVAGLPAPIALQWPGRHSLPLYLIHPPLIMGGLMVLSQLVPPTAKQLEDTAAFMNQCLSGCSEIEESVGQCTTYCGCVLTGLLEADLWSRVRRAGLDADSQRRLIEITQECRGPVFGDLPVPLARPAQEAQ